MAAVLHIGATPTTSEAFKPVSLAPLQAVVKRGVNRTLPYAPGKAPYALMLDELEVTIEWTLNGFKEPDGTPFADVELGVETNQETYRALFMDGADANGEKAATLHTALDDYTGKLQFVTFDPIDTGPATRTVLTRVRLAAGAWTPVP